MVAAEGFNDYSEDCERSGGYWLKIIDITSESSLEAFSRDVHTCTHIESPAYMFSGGKGIDQYALESFVTEAVLLDFTNKATGKAIDDEDLEAAEERAGLALREGEAVLLLTRNRGLGDGTVPEHYLSENGAQFLEFKRPSIVAIDTPCLEPYGSKELRAHSILMQSGILVLEGLCNLDEIEEPRFRLIALPLRVKASSSPVRAVAILDP